MCLTFLTVLKIRSPSQCYEQVCVCILIEARNDIMYFATNVFALNKSGDATYLHADNLSIDGSHFGSKTDAYHQLPTI
jgi:hypothetical protein